MHTKVLAQHAYKVVRRGVARAGLLGFALVLMFGSVALMAGPSSVPGSDLFPSGPADVRNIAETNQLPSAEDDAYTIVEDDYRESFYVLSNDSGYYVVSTSPSSHGTVRIKYSESNGGPRVTYTPHPNYCNTRPGRPKDTFTYMNDAGESATVTVTVMCVDDPPELTEDGPLTYVENDPPQRVAGRLLATEPDGEGMQRATAEITAGAIDAEDRLVWGDNPSDNISIDPSSTNKRIVLTGTGRPARWRGAMRAVRYRNVSDSPTSTPRTVSFEVTDFGNSTHTAGASVTVTPVEDAPGAVDDSSSVDQDAVATDIDVLANDSDPDGGAPFAITGSTPPAHGAVTLTDGGAGLSYKPTAGYCNAGAPSDAEPDDSFTYTVTGGSTATVKVTVKCAAPPAERQADPPPAPPVQSTPTAQADPPPVTVTPVVRPTRIAISHQRVRMRKGRIEVAMVCRGALGSRCRGSLSLKPTSRGTRAAKAGSAKFDVAAGKTGTIKVEPTRALLRALAKRGKVVVNATARLEGTSLARAVKRQLTVLPQRGR